MNGILLLYFHWKINCLKLAVKPKLSEFQLIQKKYKNENQSSWMAPKEGWVKTMKMTFKLFCTFLHGYPSKVLVIFTQEWDGGCSWGLSNWYDSLWNQYETLTFWYATIPLVWTTVHDASYPSAWNTEWCISRTNFIVWNYIILF